MREEIRAEITFLSVLAVGFFLFTGGQLLYTHVVLAAGNQDSALETIPMLTVVPEPATSTVTAAPTPTPVPPPLVDYIEVTDSCGPYFGGACVNVRSGPGKEFPAVGKLRRGVVLRVSEKIADAEGSEWYKVTFDEWIRYADRIPTDWYVASDYVRPFQDVGPQSMSTNTPPTAKRIIVYRGDEMLYAYEGKTLFMKESISTGLDDTPTPRGTFRIFKKTPSRYMQGPVPEISDQVFDLPGVPWTMYFTAQGGAFHGAYWHDHFGEQWSHGCVNLSPADAQKLYYWADLGTPVTILD